MDRLLDRLRKALEDVERAPEPGPVVPSEAPVDDDMLVAFRRALEEADGELAVVEDEAAARRLVAERWPGRPLVDVEAAPTAAALLRAEIGIDRADRLVAETGTVVRSYASRAAARVALVPAVSVFLAHRDDLVRDLPEALAHVAEAHGRGRAYTVLVTGPSRTADIEKQLVIPAHGPRELLVVLFRKAALESRA